MVSFFNYAIYKELLSFTFVPPHHAYQLAQADPAVMLSKHCFLADSCNSGLACELCWFF